MPIRASLIAVCLLWAAPVLRAASLTGCQETVRPDAAVCEPANAERAALELTSPADTGDASGWYAAAWDPEENAGFPSDESQGFVWCIALVLVSGGLVRYFSSDAWADYVRRLYLDY